MRLSNEVDASNPDELREWISEVARLFSLFGPITHIYHAETVIDFPSIPTNSSAADTVAVTGVKTSKANSVLVGFDGTPESGIEFTGYVSADDEVTIRAANITTGAIDPASRTYQVTVFEYD